MALPDSRSPWPGLDVRSIARRLRGSLASFSLFRIAPIAGAALLLSTRVLFQRGIFDFWGWRDIGQAVANEFFQLFLIGAVIAATMAVSMRFQPKRQPLRAISLILFLIGGSLLANVLVGIWSWTRWAFPPWVDILGATAYWTVLSGYLLLLDGAHTQALQQAAAVRRLQVAKSTLLRQLAATRLRVLEAQIEPHFLFNTLANLKRVFRLDREKGDTALANLMVYLNSALPQMRRPAASIAEEAELTRAYLELFSMRMGSRLKFVIQIDPFVSRVQMPTMMILTLVENAIKHGLMPSEHGGTIRIVARREQGVPIVAVIDDGVGFGGAATSGSGIGLVNIKARLSAMYGHQGRLVIESVETGGVSAAIYLPRESPGDHVDQFAATDNFAGLV